jgi:hypothetical protein
MAHLSGVKAGFVQEIVQPVDNATAFSLGVDSPSGTQVGRLTFGIQMADTDTVMYKAVSLQDATKWEVGLGTYVAASKTLTRTRARFGFGTSFPTTCSSRSSAVKFWWLSRERF